MTRYIVHARSRDEKTGDRYEVDADTREAAVEAYRTHVGTSALPVHRVATATDDTAG